MKKAVEILTDEHHALRGLLDDLMKALEPADLDALEHTVDELHVNLTRHRLKEEEVFFPALVCGSGVHPKVLQAAEHEHGVEDTYIEEIRAFLGVAREDASMAAPLFDACRALIVTLQDHFWKEENFVFPWAEKALSNEASEELALRMGAEKTAALDSRKGTA